MTTLDIMQYIRHDMIHKKVYTDQDIFDMEMDKIFGKTWVYMAHESEIANPGDYKTAFLGTNPVIVSRGSDDGEIRVLFNRCSHRAATVCTHESGNANFFRCAYHGWTFSNKGDLIGVPFQDGYGPEFIKKEHGLSSAPIVETYNGFIFARMCKEGPSLSEQLGHAKEYIDFVANTGPEGIELSAGAHKYEYDGNWKLQVENTIDPYHLSVTHRSFFQILGEKTGTKFNFSKMHNNEKVSDLGNGHSLYELDDDIGIGALPFNLILFPNLSFVGSHVRVVVPLSATKTRVYLYPIMLKGVPDEVNEERLRKHEGFYGPAGFGTPDDLEVSFERVISGMSVNGEESNDWLLISRGRNREVVDERGIITATSSDEVSARAIHNYWQTLMTDK